MTWSNLTSHSYWHMLCFCDSRIVYPPAGSSTQLPPTTPRSTMNRRVYSTFDSNVWNVSEVWCRPGTVTPCFSMIPRAVATMLGKVVVTLTKVLVFPSWKYMSDCLSRTISTEPMNVPLPRWFPPRWLAAMAPFRETRKGSHISSLNASGTLA